MHQRMMSLGTCRKTFKQSWYYRITCSEQRLKNKEEIKGSLAKYSKYIKHWEEGEKGDVDSTVQTIRKLTEYAEDVYGVASHI